MKKGTWIIVVIIGIIVIGLAAYRLSVRFSSEEGEKATLNKIPVKAVAVKKMDMVDKMKLTGDIVGTEVVKIFSQVPGKIHSILIKEGQRVWKSKTLFKINRDIVGMNYRLALVESPINGYIGKIMVDRGMAITPARPLAQVVNMSTVEAVVRIMEESINKVTIGMQAYIKVEAFPDKIFAGKVFRKSAVLDELSRTQEVIIKIKNSDLKLKHGMFADIEIILGKKNNILAVPEDSIIMDLEKNITTIFRIADDRAVLQKVTTGLTALKHTEIKSGLKKDDIIITLGHENVSDGDELIVYREDNRVNPDKGR